MKITLFKTVIAFLIIFISVYFINKTILIGDKEKIILFIKVIDNETGVSLTGVDISISEQRTSFKIPIPGTIIKEYHVIFNATSNDLGEAEFVVKKSKKHIIEFHDKPNHKYASIEVDAGKSKNDTIIITKKM